MGKSFLQSKEWSEFQNSLGRKTFWIKNKLVIKHNLPLGKSFLYSPRVNFKNYETVKQFLQEIKKIARKENAIFLRLEPDLNENFDIESSLEIRNCPPAGEAGKLEIVKNIQPQDTLLLDLARSKEELLTQMHPKTRYNIRLAQKHGIKIIKSTDPKDIDIFWHLALATTRRDKFRYHPKYYYKKMLEILGKEKMVNLFVAYYDNLPIAAILVLVYKDLAVYLHGASDYAYRKFMAPYLLQWEAIRKAKKRGCKFYDFWGVRPPVATEEQKNIETEKQNKFLSSRPQRTSWAGITRFKMGFVPQGKIIHYPDCLEIIFQSGWYWLYNLARKIKP